MNDQCSKFGRDVNLENPMNHHPNPYFERDNYHILNGEWDFEIIGRDGDKKYRGKITAPFSPETKLSGVGRKIEKDDLMTYKKYVVFGKENIGNTALLHFEAVDQICDVYIDDKLYFHHEGGYFRFEFQLVINKEAVCIKVNVTDDTLSPIFPRGKQSINPKGIMYTATSGIWGSVWYEIVPATNRILSITNTPLYEEKKLKVDVVCDEDCSVDVIYDDKVVASQKTMGGSAIIDLSASFHPWSPNKPNLYDVIAHSSTDKIKSVVGMRKWSSIKYDGRCYVGLNGKPIFLNALLDQGYFPESGLTYPSEEAIINDLNFVKNAGFNCLRKHIKIEQLRWYYNCDKLGIIVNQDFVCSGDQYKQFLMMTRPLIKYEISDKNYKILGRRSEESRKQFESDIVSTILQLRNINCIGVWTLFNEGWGQFDTERLTSLLQSLDDSRLIDSTSGWFDKQCGNFKSEHIYFKKLNMSNDGNRILSLSEFGGYSYKVENHAWNNRNFGYKRHKNLSELQLNYRNLYFNEVIPQIEKEGLSMSVYTQLTDVEEELNGLLTYDREVCKFDIDELREINEELYSSYEKSFERKGIKIAFFDIDGTLYDNTHKRFCHASIEAVKKLQDSGVKVILCTARPYHSFDLLGVNDLGVKWDGYIGSAGAVVEVDGNYLRKDLMDPKTTKELSDIVMSDGNCLEIVMPKDRILIGVQNESSKKFYDYFSESIPETKTYNDEECTGVNLFCDNKFDEKYKSSFPGITFCRYCDFAIDVIPFPRAKGEGIQLVLKHYGLSKEDAIGFGDDMQDISIANNVGFFVSMGQGKSEVKEASNYIAEPVWSEGVAMALSIMHLI